MLCQNRNPGVPGSRATVSHALYFLVLNVFLLHITNVCETETRCPNDTPQSNVYLLSAVEMKGHMLLHWRVPHILGYENHFQKAGVHIVIRATM